MAFRPFNVQELRESSRALSTFESARVLGQLVEGLRHVTRSTHTGRYTPPHAKNKTSTTMRPLVSFRTADRCYRSLDEIVLSCLIQYIRCQCPAVEPIRAENVCAHIPATRTLTRHSATPTYSAHSRPSIRFYRSPSSLAPFFPHPVARLNASTHPNALHTPHTYAAGAVACSFRKHHPTPCGVVAGCSRRIVDA